MLPKLTLKFGRTRTLLSGLTVGILTGLLLTATLNRHSGAAPAPGPTSTPFDVARLAPPELETLALEALSALRKQREADADKRLEFVKYSWDDPPNEQQIRLGMRNARRLLPLVKKLTLESLGASLKTSGLSRERRLIAAVRHLVLDPRLGSSAEVREENLSVVHVGPEYAAYLTSDDEAVLMLGHELTHVAARAGRLNHFIRGVSEKAWRFASVEPRERQKEDLACDFIGAEALKRFIALHPTDEADAVRFSRVFGYETPSERLARAWEDFCASYEGDHGDEEHLGRNQTVRALLRLDPELRTLVPDDASSKRLCR